MDKNLLYKNNFNRPLKNNDYSFYKIAFQRRYYGARYQDPKTSRWLSTDPALGEYIPGAPVNDEVKKQNQNLPGMGGVFNTVNFHLYHYAGNNPINVTDPNGKVIFQVMQKYLMTDQAYADEKLGSSNSPVNSQGCFVSSMANSQYTFEKPASDNPRYQNLVLKISRDVSNFGNDPKDAFKFGEYGKALFGGDMASVEQGKDKDNSTVLAKLADLKKSDKTYAVFGIFETDYGPHMVPLNDVAGDDKSFSDSIIMSSKNDTNWDNRFDESKLSEIRYFEITE